MVKCRMDSSTAGWLSLIECHEVLSLPSSGLTFLFKVGKKLQKTPCWKGKPVLQRKESNLSYQKPRNKMNEARCLAFG